MLELTFNIEGAHSRSGIGRPQTHNADAAGNRQPQTLALLAATEFQNYVFPTIDGDHERPFGCHASVGGASIA